MEDRQEKVLVVEFWLEPKWGKSELPSLKGNLQFEEGASLQAAAAWCEEWIHKFLYRAIEDRPTEVKIAMGEVGED